MADTTVEGFVTDLAFTDQSKNISELFPSTTGNVAELSSNALSYFTQPSRIIDKRDITTRSVNWAAQTSPQIMVDAFSFADFAAVAATLPASALNQLFAVTDKLLLNYSPTLTHDEVEADLTTNAATKDIYVAGSYSLSTLIVTDTVYTDGNAPKTVSVPAYAIFDIKVPSGSTTRTFTLKLYASIQSWLTTYSQSTIVEVVPALPYSRIFDASLVTATDNIFSTASLAASLSFNTLQASLKNTTVSGMVDFRAILQDSSNTLALPFNILYKGRAPTLFEIRNAIRQELLTSGVGNETEWKKRIPGVFVSGRFYVVPFWDKTFQKPDQKIFPNVLNFQDMADTVEKILGTLGYAKITEYMDVVSIYYNHMTAAVIPDQSGTVDVQRLGVVMPDYQSYSPSDPQFTYMLDITQAFTRDLNSVLTLATDDQTSSVYGPNVEGILTFYSYTAGSYEICVISKGCYEAILESEQ